MNIFPVLIGVPLSIAFASLGRWLLLHPERLVPKGQFMGPNTFGARLFRLQVTAVGTLAVFFGASGSIFAALYWIASFAPVLLTLPVILGGFFGVYSVTYVRKELKSRPAYISNNPHGWWP
jgi:hypothetical protein